MDNSPERDFYEHNAFNKPDNAKQQSLKKDPVLIGLEDLTKILKAYTLKLNETASRDIIELKKSFESSIQEALSKKIDVNLVASDIDMGKLFADSISDTISDNLESYFSRIEDHSENLSKAITDGNKKVLEEVSRTKIAKMAEVAFGNAGKETQKKDKDTKESQSFADKLVARMNPAGTIGKTAGFLTGDPSEMMFKFMDGLSKKNYDHAQKMAEHEKSLSGAGWEDEDTPSLATSNDVTAQPDSVTEQTNIIEDADISAKTVVVNGAEIDFSSDNIVQQPPHLKEKPSISTVTSKEQSTVTEQQNPDPLQQTVEQDLAEKEVKTVKLDDDTIEELILGISENSKNQQVALKPKAVETPSEKNGEKKEGGGIGSLIMEVLKMGAGLVSFIPKLGALAAGAKGLVSAASVALPAVKMLGGIGGVAAAGAAGYAIGTAIDEKFDVSGKVASLADSAGLTDVSKEDQAKTTKMEGDLRRKKMEIFGTDKPSKAMLAANSLVKRNGGGKFEPTLFKSLKEVDKFEYDGEVYDLNGKPVGSSDEKGADISSKGPSSDVASLSETVQQKQEVESPVDMSSETERSSGVAQHSPQKATQSEKSGGDVISISNNEQSVSGGSRTLQYDRDYVYLSRDKFRGSMSYSRGLT